mgnify:CR=1 FL=1
MLMKSVEQNGVNKDVAGYCNDYQVLINYWIAMGWFNEAFPGDGPHLGMHYGYYPKDSQGIYNPLTPVQAVIEMNRQLMRRVGWEEDSDQADKLVLDAGSGIGGTAKYIATHHGARVEGITLSSVQIKIANFLAKRYGFSQKANFSLQDYNHTKFPNDHFDVYHASETLNYAVDKKDPLKEAMRTLKPGGRIVVGDGFLGRDPYNDGEKTIYKRWLDSWRIPNLARPGEFRNLMQEVGFEEITMDNVTENIWPISEYLRDKAESLSLPIKVINVLKGRPISELPGGALQWPIIENGIGVYYLFSATKPIK